MMTQRVRAHNSPIHVNRTTQRRPTCAHAESSSNPIWAPIVDILQTKPKPPHKLRKSLK